MACSTLTDTKLIMSLGPDRSILGTIIGPNKVLLERKGGSNGDVTFTSVLPGAGEPLQNASGVHKDIVGEDGVAKKSKKVVKMKKIVKVKKIKKVVTERKSTSAAES